MPGCIKLKRIKFLEEEKFVSPALIKYRFFKIIMFAFPTFYILIKTVV